MFMLVSPAVEVVFRLPLFNAMEDLRLLYVTNLTSLSVEAEEVLISLSVTPVLISSSVVIALLLKA